MLTCMNTFAHDLSTYLANILPSLTSYLDFIVFNFVHFYLP